MSVSWETARRGGGRGRQVVCLFEAWGGAVAVVCGQMWGGRKRGREVMYVSVRWEERWRWKGMCKCGVGGMMEVVCGQVWGGRNGGGSVWASVGWKER